MKILYLHIGTPKTGTSALQTFLCKNREFLHKNGICYPVLSDEQGVGQPVILEQLYSGSPYKIKSAGSVSDFYRKLEYDKFGLTSGNAAESTQLGAEDVYGYFALLCAYFASNPADVLMSSELYWLKWDNKKAYFEQLKQLPYQIKVIVYLRRQDEFLSSVVNQNIKIGLSRSLSYPECLDGLLIRLDYLKELEEIASVIGRENIIVRRYYKGLDIVPDFLDALNIPIDDSCVLPPKTINPHLSRKSLEIMSSVNRRVSNATARSLICDILLDISVKSKKGTSDLFLWDENVRKEILDKYEESNNELARLYLGEDRLFDR